MFMLISGTHRCVTPTCWLQYSRTHLPMQETQGTKVQSLGWEDLLEVATHPSILVWEVPSAEEYCGLQSEQSQRVHTQMVKGFCRCDWTKDLEKGWEHSLEKEMATYSSVLVWKIPWMEEPGQLQSMVWQESDTTEQLLFLLEMER